MTQTVSQDGTTSLVISSVNPSASGQAVVFTAVEIADAPGTGTPTGSVTFKDGSTTLATQTPQRWHGHLSGHLPDRRRPLDHGRLQRRCQLQEPAPRTFSPRPSVKSAPRPRRFLEKDATTQGNWIGTYGAQGYDIVSGPTSLPANDTVTPSGQSTYTWTKTSTDPRALQVPGSSNRVAAVWYSATSFTVDVNLADGQAHDLELYFDDWDNKGRGEQVQISDAGTGTVLDTETISSFSGGVYLDWKVSGNLVITITRTAGTNAVLNGLFLDPTSSPPPAATATFLEQDATTQGSWVDTYGAQGYDIVSGPTSLPASDTVTPSGQSTYTWTTTSTDPRALQVPGSSNRVAAVWYSATSFTVDVNLADGQAHDLELYFDDWDNKGRGEQVQISDAGTGTVLDTETISSFSGGVYLDWKVSGNLVITITRTAGDQCRPQRPLLRSGVSEHGDARRPGVGPARWRRHSGGDDRHRSGPDRGLARCGE